MGHKITVPLVPECSTCIINSLRTLIPLLSNDKEEQFRLYSLAFDRLAKGYGHRIEPAPLSISLYQELYEVSGNMDPYRDLKDQSNEAAKKVLPTIENFVDEHTGYEKLRVAIAAAISGNIIDFNTAGHSPNLDELLSLFEEILEAGFNADDSKYLWKTISEKNGSVVYLADNTGETFFDIPLLRILKEHGWTITYIVKGQPMINDATEEDVRGTEIEQLAHIATTGAWAHGVPRDMVSNDFLQMIRDCDLVISKGQANIETFPEIQREVAVETYYLVKGKCPHISQSMGYTQGNNIVLRRPALI